VEGGGWRVAVHVIQRKPRMTMPTPHEFPEANQGTRGRV